MITISASKGINNANDANKLPNGFVRECIDFDINANGLLTQRAGYYYVGSSVRSIFSPAIAVKI